MAAFYKYLLEYFCFQWILLLPFRYKAIQCVPIDLYLSRFISYASSFIASKLSFEKTPLDLGSS